MPVRRGPPRSVHRPWGGSPHDVLAQTGYRSNTGRAYYLAIGGRRVARSVGWPRARFTRTPSRCIGRITQDPWASVRGSCLCQGKSTTRSFSSQARRGCTGGPEMYEPRQTQSSSPVGQGSYPFPLAWIGGDVSLELKNCVFPTRKSFLAAISVIAVSCPIVFRLDVSHAVLADLAGSFAVANRACRKRRRERGWQPWRWRKQPRQWCRFSPRRT